MASRRHILLQMQPRLIRSSRRRVAACAGEIGQVTSPRMMRQYDSSSASGRTPDTNENLLNRGLRLRHEGAWARKPARPAIRFLASAEGRGDPHRPQARRRHHCSQRCCTTPSRTPRLPRRIDHVFGHEIGALVEGLTKLKRLELVSREAKQPRTCASCCWRSPTTSAFS